MPSIIQADQLKSANGVTTYLNNGTLSNLTFPAGHIIQVVQSDKTDTSQVQSASWTDIGGTDNNGSGSIWCCKITPSATSSKILICATVMMGRQNGNNSPGLLLLRNSTSIWKGDSAGSRTPCFAFGYGNSNLWSESYSAHYLDSPSTTSEITYKIQFRSESTSYLSAINKSYNDTDASHNGYRGASNLLLMEVTA